MNEWLKQELETATAEHHNAYIRHSNLIPGTERDGAKAAMDYWNGYADAITNALHELTGMDNE